MVTYKQKLVGEP